MTWIVTCGIICLFFLSAFGYGIHMLIRDWEIVGWAGAMMCCLPLGFAVLCGGRTAEAILKLRGRTMP